MEERAYLEWLSSYTDAETAMAAFRIQKQFFRVNTIKISPEEFSSRSGLKKAMVPYCGHAFEFQESFQIGRTWEYFLGLIHPQSLPSILVSLVLGPVSGETVLDVASAPGSKLSHMAALMENKGVLVGNDLKKEKISAIYSTINRLNILNCIVTDLDGSRLPWKERFDRVLLDAPCTALGSGASASSRWEPENSSKISILQKAMIEKAYDALKPGGVMVYSTCTYAKEENEEVVKHVLESRSGAGLEDIALDFPHERGISDFGEEFSKVRRIYPQHLSSEGFFMAKIRKG
ncbi:MAG: RsmB/NOP family class I SAM-dependent RNA methyltransferase [Candidatus Micrarchaeota archaeon]